MLLLPHIAREEDRYKYTACHLRGVTWQQANLQSVVLQAIALRLMVQVKGVTIATDGWSDPQRRPILNFMAVTESGPMFLKAINTEGEVKTVLSTLVNLFFLSCFFIN